MEEKNVIDFENVLDTRKTENGRVKLILLNLVFPKQNDVVTKVMVVHETFVANSEKKYKKTIREVCYNGKDLNVAMEKFHQVN